MVVVQDMFLTETARFADVVLPAAGWGEKLGTFTNVDRTVHLSERAVDPPGEARSDLDIFLEYARRMDFRDRDGAPLIKWHDAESAFEAWKACSAGRPCDYTGMTYDRLRGGSGIQWPCTAAAPDGTERLYVDGHFNTDPDYCETFGQDLDDGSCAGRGVVPRQGAARPRIPARRRVRAVSRGAGRRVPAAAHDRAHALPLPHAHEDRPRAATPGGGTGRLGRGESGRREGTSRSARAISSPSESRRGEMQGRVRISDIRRASCSSRSTTATGIGRTTKVPRAANELTRTSWDPVSKQPQFKVAAVRVRKLRDGDGPRRQRRRTPHRRRPERRPDMHLAHYLALLHRSQAELGDAFRTVAHSHADEHDVHAICEKLAAQCDRHAEQLRPFAERYGEDANGGPDRLHREIFGGPREGPLGLLRDLHDLYLMACECDIAWTLVGQAAQGARDRELLALVQTCEGETATQITWARNRMKEAAPQALVVAS